MVHVELRTPIHESDSSTVRWEPLVALRAENGHEPEIEGDRSLFDVEMPVVSLRSGETIRFADNREEWTRSLVIAYRGGDLVAAITHDDDPVTERSWRGLPVTVTALPSDARDRDLGDHRQGGRRGDPPRPA